MSRWHIEEKSLRDPGNGIAQWDRLDRYSLASFSLAANQATPPIEGVYFDMAALHITWSGLDTFDNVFEVEGSIDGSVYCKLSGLDVTPTAATGHHIFSIPTLTVRFIRVGYIKGTATAGTFTARYLLKSRL
jgi:hypothetical protein